jgi:hypothetical protein
MSHYYFKVVASPDGQWQTRWGARVLATYRDFNQALTRARVEVDLHRPYEVGHRVRRVSRQLPEWIVHSSVRPCG